VHPEFKEALAKREAASAVIARQPVDDLRLQVKHYKALSQANSAANCDADSKEESEGDWEEANRRTAAAVNRDRCFSSVSSSVSLSSTSIVVVPTYLSLAKTSRISDIPPFAATKHGRKIAQKAKITLVRKQQIASYLSMENSLNTVSRKTPTQSRIHFCVSNSVVRHGQSQSTSCRISPILRGSDSRRSSASLVTDSPCTLLPMKWGKRCLHQSSDIHHDKSTSDYSFENWTAPTSASANLWSFNSENPSTALLRAVMDTGAQHSATSARTY